MNLKKEKNECLMDFQKILEKSTILEDVILSMIRFVNKELNSISLIFAILKSESNMGFASHLDIFVVFILSSEKNLEKNEKRMIDFEKEYKDVIGVNFEQFKSIFGERTENLENVLQDLNLKKPFERFQSIIGLKSQWKVFKSHFLRKFFKKNITFD